MKTKKTLIVLFFSMLSILVWAYDFEKDGLCYNVISPNNVEITYKNADTVNSYFGDIIIPSTITHRNKKYHVIRIGKYAFGECKNLTSLIIPDGVTGIEGSAFFGCETLRSMVIPNGVTDIGNSAFTACTNLSSITIPESVTNIDVFAFALCSSLTSISIPDGVKDIKGATFAGCYGLVSISFPDSLESIGRNAFFQCKSLKSITIPEKVTSLEDCAIFLECKSLKRIEVKSDIPARINIEDGRDIDLVHCTLIVPAGSKSRYKEAKIWKDFGTIEENLE
jgi:hypothetical protein